MHPSLIDEVFGLLMLMFIAASTAWLHRSCELPVLIWALLSSSIIAGVFDTPIPIISTSLIRSLELNYRDRLNGDSRWT
ncbi:unnamed protein product [Lactuca saligna]|uniref:Uncharacterized protein n=1 Tax=Lactuca saligna TaxID=75948 RepID=A0AA35Z579_LACSI|nr:unnamed protein product [Lactuca saligna]